MKKSAKLLKIGVAIRKARDKEGFSQEELAFRCGLHRTYVGSVERGERNVSLTNVSKIASALGLSAAELLENARL